MDKVEYQKYLASDEWKEKRLIVFKLFKSCFKCDIPRWVAKIAYGHDLHVHHTNYANVTGETWEDLIPLCRRCHEIETFGKSSLVAPWSAKCAVCQKTVFDQYQDDTPYCEFHFYDTYCPRPDVPDEQEVSF